MKICQLCELNSPIKHSHVFICRVASEKALPFNVHVPNTETIKAMQEAKSGKLKKYSTIKALLDDLNAEN